MADEGFLRRWARRKTESSLAEGAPPEEAPLPVVPHVPHVPDVPEARGVPDAPARLLPSMDDVARLTPDADFSAFVARGVDPAVRRGALKKLFADPHFNAMDGLDIYIDDYTKPSPVSAAMLASLTHAKRVLNPFLDEEKPAQEGTAEQGIAAAALPGPVLEPAPVEMADTPAAGPAPEHPTTPEPETQETQ